MGLSSHVRETTAENLLSILFTSIQLALATLDSHPNKVRSHSITRRNTDMCYSISTMEAYALISAITRLLQEILDAPKDFANLVWALERVERFQASLIDQDLMQDQQQRFRGLWKHYHKTWKRQRRF
ncbi:hypothetical protein MMC27_001124 [Xylographa pallens]|nr:hypothetical protein [Xylographa pallens]